MLMIYLIDYENDESVKILNEIIQEKETNKVKKLNIYLKIR